MDTSHPIPQDVTGFQFKLIGSMTVKQFAYLAVPAVLDWILYYAQAIPWYIRLPLMLIFGLIGVALAFLPIEGRPADLMLRHFINALFIPNQYIYHKTGQNLAFATLQVKKAAPKQINAQQSRLEQQKEQQLQYLLQSSQQQNSGLDEREAAFMHMAQFPNKIIQTQQPKSGFHLPFFGGNQHPNMQPPPAVKPIAPSPARPSVELPPLPGSKPIQAVLPQPIKPIVTVQSAPPAHQPIPIMPSTHPAPDNYAQFQKTQEEKAKIQQELTRLQKQQQTPPIQPIVKPAIQTPKTPVPPYVKTNAKDFPSTKPKVAVGPAPIAHVTKISKEMAHSMGLPNVPDTPNLITGIIKDPRGNVLANMLVEVKDKDGNPVRAFKTNQLGQIASATPLLNGTYTIVFEDPAAMHKFDTIEIHAKGEIILPIGIVSHDAREELRRALFN